MDFENIVASVLEVPASDVTDAAGPDTLPSWTSLRHLQLIVTLEEAYAISFGYQEIRDVKRVADLRRAVGDKHGRTETKGEDERDGRPVVG